MSDKDLQRLEKESCRVGWLLIIAVLCGAVWLGCYVGTYAMEKKAIRHGAGQHNPQTGAFEWKGDGNE